MGVEEQVNIILTSVCVLLVGFTLGGQDIIQID